MRLQLDAEPGEIAGKREHLLRAMAAAVSQYDSELAERLQKAVQQPAGRLRYLAMRQLQQTLNDGYRQHIEEAMRKVAKVLSQARFEVRKARPQVPLQLRKGE